MKRTLAFVIAVVMVLVMIPATIFSAAGQAGDPPEQQGDPTVGGETGANGAGTPTLPAPDLATDFFEVLDESGAHVDFYPDGNDGLLAADNALENGYTLVILQPVTLDDPYTWGTGRSTPISYTVTGAENALVTGTWVVDNDSALDKITFDNVAINGGDDNALVVSVSGAGNTVSVTLIDSTLSGMVALNVTGAPGANTGAVVQLLGDNILVGSTIGVNNSGAMLIAGGTVSGDSVGVVNAAGGKLYVTGGTLMGNATAGVGVSGGSVVLAGGTIGVTGTTYNDAHPVAALTVLGGSVSLMGATLAAPASAAGATADADPITENIYALYTEDASFVHIYSMTAVCAAGKWNNVDLTVSPYSAVGGNDNAALVTIAEDLTGAEALITMGDATIAAFDLEDAADLGGFNFIAQLVPDGATLKLLIDMDVAGSPHLFDYMPEMDVTLEGAKAGDDPVVDFHSNVTSGVAAVYTSAHVTLKNIVFRASAANLTLLRNAAYGSLTVGEGAALVNESDDAAAVAADLQSGATLIVAEGGRVQAKGRLATLANGSALVLDGGEMKITATDLTVRPIALAAATGFTALTAPAKITFNSGDVWTVGGPGYLLPDALAAAALPDFEIDSVRFLPTIYGANAEDHAVVIADNRVELLDANGEHVDYYGTIADALADIADGYTVKLLGDHFETKWISNATRNISWTLDGALENGERANVYAVWTSNGGGVASNSAIRLAGNNAEILFTNLVLHSMNNVISVAASSGGGARLTLEDVFLFGGGALEADGLTGVAAANNREYAMYIAPANTVRITGENSGSYIYYNGTATIDYQWISFRNAGTLMIEDGFYTHPLPGGAVVATRDDGTARTVVTGGTFYASNAAGGNLFSIMGGSSPATTANIASLRLAGGTFVSNAGYILTTMNGDNNSAYATISGGKFYTNTLKTTISAEKAQMAALGSAPYTLLNLIGGEFYFQGTDAPLPTAGTGSVGTTKIAETGTSITIGGANAVKYGLFDTTYALGEAEEDYVPTAAAGDPMDLLTQATYTKRVISQASAAIDPADADVLVYASENDTEPLYAFAGPNSAYDAVMATYGMDGAVIELQSDLAMPDGTTLTMNNFGTASTLIVTGAGDTPVTLSLNASAAMIFTGYTILKNIKIENAGGPAVGVTGNGSVLELVNAEISGGITVASLSTLIVDENSYVYATGAGNAITVSGAGNAHIYGKVGYNADDELVADLTGSAISVIAPSEAMPFLVHVYGTAWVATPSTSKGTIATKDGPFTSGARYPGDVIVDDGARLESNYCFFTIRYGDLTVGDAHLYDTDRDGNGNLQNPDCTWYFDLENVNSLTLTNFTLETRGTTARPIYVSCPANITTGLTPTVTMTDVNITATLQTASAYFAFVFNCNVYMTRVNLNMANPSSNAVYGVRCYGSDVASTERLEAVFEDCRWVFNSTPSATLMYLYGYMDYTFRGDNGYYDMVKNGQVMSCLGATNPGGVTTIEGGTFVKKGATQGMINIQGTGFNMVINNAFFDADKSTIFSLSAANTALTINGGTFYRDGVLGSFIAISNAGTATVNGGTIVMGTKPITLNTSYDSMLFSVTHASAVLNVKGGDFLVNLDAFTNKIRAIMLMTAGTFNMSGGSITVTGSAAGNATLQDGIVLQGQSYFNMSGGTITFQGQIAGTYHMIWTQGSLATSLSEIHLSGNAHIVADYVPVAGSAGNTGNHGMGIFYLRNGAPVFTMDDDVVLESRAAGSTLSNSAVIEPMANATVVINGGYVYDYNGGSAIHLWRGANVEINGGYFESNGQAVLLADNWVAGETSDYNAALKHGFYVNGGTYVLQPSSAIRSASDADAVVKVAVNVADIKGGIFINNSMSSSQIVNRTSTAGTVYFDGGLYMASAAQSYFFRTVDGATATGDLRPHKSVSVVVTSAPVIRYAGRNYYLYGSTAGNLLAPETSDTVNIRLWTDGDGNSHDGLLFTSTIKTAVYAALQVQIANLMDTTYAGATDYTIEYGTLIAPVDNILKTDGDFSAKAFKAYNDAVENEENLLPYVVIPAVNGYVLEPDDSVTIRAALIGIDEDHYETSYTAQPYATVTFTDGTNTVGEPWTIYPNFDTNKSVASLSVVASRALRDISAVREAPYLYKSISAKGAYSRFSAAQQATLQGYVAHVHDYGHTGVCAICGDDLATTLTVDQTITIYGSSGYTAYYKVHLAAGIAYAVRMSNAKIGTYALYNANGEACTFENGHFNCTAEGDYYLVLTTNTLASSTLALEHVHTAGYQGYCSICEQDLCVEITLEERMETTVRKGETYYFKADLVESDYSFMAVNGNYVVYDADGHEVPVENNVFTSTGGTYYFVVTATFSAKGSVYLEHVHDFGYTGVCSYPGCGETVTKDLTPYTRYSGLHKDGEKVYFRTTIPAGIGSDVVDGRRFNFTFGTTFVGTYTVYDADGARVSGSGGYQLDGGATYYMVVELQYTGNLEVTLTYTHDHNEDADYIDHRGICTLCGASAGRNLGAVNPNFAKDYPLKTVAGQRTYHLYFTDVPANFLLNIALTGVEGATVAVYGQASTAFGTQAEAEASGASAYAWFNYDTAAMTGVYFANDTARDVYVLITFADAPDEHDLTVSVSHTHTYRPDGTCTGCSGISANRKEAKLNEADAVAYTAGETYYYAIANIDADHAFNVEFDGADAAWTLYNAEGVAVHDSEAVGPYILTASGAYNLVVTAAADSAADATITISATPGT